MWEFSRELVREAMRDRITGEAAQMAYFFFLSLFPLILALFALTGIFGGDEAFRWIMAQVRALLPGEASEYLEGFVGEVTGPSRPGILSFSILLTFWSASNIFAALTHGLNTIWDVEQRRRWWVRRVRAFGLLLAAIGGLVLGAVALLTGPELARALGVSRLWIALRWPGVFLLATAVLFSCYLLLPNIEQRRFKGRILVGAAAGSALWMLGTTLFRLYVANFGRYSTTYGLVGGILVLLIWLYLAALTILFGAEIAACLEQRAWSLQKREGTWRQSA